jgi:hypothetical protein
MFEEPEKNTWEWEFDEIHAVINGVSWFANVTMAGDICWKLKDFECLFTGRSSEEWVGKAINPRLASIDEAYNGDTDQVEPLPEGGWEAFSLAVSSQINLNKVWIANVDPQTNEDF